MTTEVEKTTVAAETTVAETAAVDTTEPPPVVETATVVKSAGRSIWTTEEGELVPGARVKRIRLAQDVLNTAEESVYDVLWSAKGAPREESDGARIVQAGYDFLMKRTRLSKKTIQRIVDRLIAKDFIAIERPADIYQRTATVYRVFSYRSVLDRQAAKGRLHVVKIGPGLLYVHPLANPSTVDASNQSTVDRPQPATGAPGRTVTRDAAHPTTVVPGTTKKIEQPFPDKEASSELLALRRRIEGVLGPIDDEALRKLLTECRARAGDCTVEEVAYFAEHKLRWVRNLHNPIGFLLTAVPRHFENGAHLSVREMLRKQSEARRQEWRDTQEYWRRIADDPAQPPEDRAEARKVLANLPREF